MDERSVKPDGPTIVRLRKMKGWRNEDLADKSGCSIRTVANATKGNNVSVLTLMLLAKALAVEPHTLIAGETEKKELFSRMQKEAEGRNQSVVTVEIKIRTPFGDFDASKDADALIRSLIELLEKKNATL